MTIAVSAQVLLIGALLLALGFRRYRAVQVLFVLIAMCTALVAADPRLQLGALRFGPLLLLTAALMPEPALLSRRNALFVLAVLVLGTISAGAPEHVFTGLARAAGWLAFNTEPATGAAGLCAAASLLCLLRWAISGRPIEFGLVLVLALAAAAVLQDDPFRQLVLFAGAGAAGALAVLYASYRMAFVDGLTGLPNRRALDETLMRLSGGYALAMVDVDHFKQFNDNYGHDAGDLVLRAVARTLRQHSGAQAFRYGGEEFCLVYDGSREQSAASGCERVRAAVEQQRTPVPAPDKRAKRDEKRKRPRYDNVAVTISLGCAARGGERRAAAEVLKIADQALYKAKAKGRNRVVLA